MGNLAGPMREPVIIIGMHRSGTSMVTRIMEDLGVFVGRDRGEELRESQFFSDLNTWALRLAGARWDHPQGGRCLLENSDIRCLMADYLRMRLRSPRSLAAFGWRDHRDLVRHGKLSHPWGWKDPRSTFTLPLWLEVFPQARVVHVWRHGVDVAQSLHRIWAPDAALIARVRAAFQKRRYLYYMRPMGSGYTFIQRAATLDGCLDLWDEYTLRAREVVTALGDRAMDVCYEELLADPIPAVSALAWFCRLDVSPAQIDAAAARCRPDRAYAFRRVPELAAFAQESEDTLQRHGYNAVGRVPSDARAATSRSPVTGQPSVAAVAPAAPSAALGQRRLGWSGRDSRRVSAVAALGALVALVSVYAVGRATGEAKLSEATREHASVVQVATVQEARGYLYRAAVALGDADMPRAAAELMSARRVLAAVDAGVGGVDAGRLREVRIRVNRLTLGAPADSRQDRARVLEVAAAVHALVPASASRDPQQ